MYIDNLIATLDEIHQALDQPTPNVEHSLSLIEATIDSFNLMYGSNSTARLKVISEERKKHAKELNGKDTD